jgi:uncharacterized protein YndB with AHSA1/START domain
LDPKDRLKRSPQSENRAIELALLWTALLVLIGFGIRMTADGNYGIVGLLAAPFLAGFYTTFLSNLGSSGAATTSLGLTILGYVGLFFVLPLIVGEGAICLIIALPLMLPPAIVGSYAGRAFALRSIKPSAVGVVASLLIFFALAHFHVRPEPCAPIEVLSSVEIDASVDEVWKHVTAFSEITEVAPWWFRLGVAYPVRARIDGEGVGAVRHCEFSTGPFVEPITAWEPPHRLAFDVTSQPPPMKELSFFDIHPAHLDHAWVSQRGEFRLIALPDGRTRLEGRTWYTLAIDPVSYWSPVASKIIHEIHGRVLRHIRTLAESR